MVGLDDGGPAAQHGLGLGTVAGLGPQMGDGLRGVGQRSTQAPSGCTTRTPSVVSRTSPAVTSTDSTTRRITVPLHRPGGRHRAADHRDRRGSGPSIADSVSRVRATSESSRTNAASPSIAGAELGDDEPAAAVGGEHDRRVDGPPAARSAADSEVRRHRQPVEPGDLVGDDGRGDRNGDGRAPVLRGDQVEEDKQRPVVVDQLDPARRRW